VFDHFPPGFYFVIAMTALILVLAANTAFNGFPVLGSILAQDRYLPRQLHTRGDRLAFSNGIMFLAIFAMVLIVAFQAETTRLIQLYIVGVFVSFTLSQTGMVRHWNKLLRVERDPAVRRRMIRSRTINMFGLVMTGFVLILVLATKFTKGAWISIAAMAVIYVLMVAIRRHYDHVATELIPTDDRPILPSRNHAVGPGQQGPPADAAGRRVRAGHPAGHADRGDGQRGREGHPRHPGRVGAAGHDRAADRGGQPVPGDHQPDRRLREVVAPRVAPRRGDRLHPEYVVGKWWEHLLHNQSALRIKTRLLFEPGVMVTSVPWQLSSSAGKDLDRLAQNLARTPQRGPRGFAEEPPERGEVGAPR
jgi:hypothetical protein